MKYEEARKQLIKESSIIGAAVAILAVAVYYFGTVGAGYGQVNTSLQNQVASIRAETVRMQDQYNRMQKNKALYEEVIKKNADHQLTIGRQTIREHFGKLRNRYYLNNLHLTMSPIAAMDGSQDKNKTGNLESSDVMLNFDALSDEYVYDMIQAMQQELPGSSKVTSLTLTRVQPLSDAALLAIGQTGAFSLVVGEMKFTWFGIHSKESDNADAPPKK